MRRHLLPVCTAAVLACMAAPAIGAQVLRPGSGLSTDRILPRADTFDLFLDGRSRGTPDAAMTLETRFAEVDGAPAVIRRETLWFEGEAVQVDSFVLARETLAPLSSRSEGIGRSGSLDFSADRVRGWARVEGQRHTVDVALSERVFLAASMDVVLGALPLRPGYAAELAFFDADEGEVAVHVRVEELENVALPAGEVRAWRVRVRGSGSEGTYWMQEDTRSLVRFVAADRSMQIIRAGGNGERKAAR